MDLLLEEFIEDWEELLLFSKWSVVFFEERNNPHKEVLLFLSGVISWDNLFSVLFLLFWLVLVVVIIVWDILLPPPPLNGFANLPPTITLFEPETTIIYF